MADEENPTLAELTARLNASADAMDKAYADTAIMNLAFTVTYASRFALGCFAKYDRPSNSWNVTDDDREAVAQVLDDLAAAVRNPSDVAENMSPIRHDEF